MFYCQSRTESSRIKFLAKPVGNVVVQNNESSSSNVWNIPKICI